MTRDPQTIDLFVGSAEIVRCPAPTKLIRRNPCVVWFGPGPEGSRCADCRYLERHSRHPWIKCGLRLPGGPAADHRVGWPACARFEATDDLR